MLNILAVLPYTEEQKNKLKSYEDNYDVKVHFSTIASASQEEVDQLLPRADYVAMVLPGTPETRHIMDERRLRLMKPTAYLLNAGRGNAIDLEALNKVLREGGVIGGVALDVTEPEPLPQDSPLWDAPRCIITPHIAGKFNLPETFVRLFNIPLTTWTSSWLAIQKTCVIS